MTNEELEELLEARMREIEESLQSMMLTDGHLPSDYNAAASEVVGISFDGGGKYFDYLAFMLRRRGGLGVTTLDEAVTHLNNLPLGLRIAELQRAEVLEAEPELAEALETEITNDNSPMKKEHWEHFVNLKPVDYNYEDLDSDADFFKAEVEQDAKSLEQLCDEYEAGLVEGKHAPEAVAYIMALEDLVSEMQGKSFTDSSRIGQLEAENAALRRYLKVEDGKEPVKPS